MLNRHVVLNERVFPIAKPMMLMINVEAENDTKRIMNKDNIDAFLAKVPTTTSL